MGTYVDKLTIGAVGFPEISPFAPSDNYEGPQIEPGTTWPIITDGIASSETISSGLLELLQGDGGYLDQLAAIIDEFPKDKIADIEYNSVIPSGIQSIINWTERAFSETFATILQSKLETDLVDGATGIGGTVEQDLFDREIARQGTESSKIQEDIEDSLSFAGFPLPTGAYVTALQEHALVREAAVRDTTQKIGSDQADLIQKNNQFAVTAAMQLDKMKRDFVISRDTLTLDEQKAIANHLIAAWTLYEKEASAEMTAAIASADTSIKGYQAEYQLRAEALKSLVAAVMQAFVSVYGRVNMSASLQSSGSRQVSESTTHHESKSNSTQVSVHGQISTSISNQLSESHQSSE